MTDISDVLKQIQEQLAGTKEREFYQPGRRIFLSEFLVPQGWDKSASPVIVNVYVPNPPDGYPEAIQVPDTHAVVVHGHEQGKTCYASTYCHALGYSPTGAEHPSFLKQWRMKWKKE